MLLMLLTFILSFNATANPTGMDEAQMEKMMQQAQAAQSCFEGIDESYFKKLEKEGLQMQKDIEALCKAGKSKEATQKGMQYSLKMYKDPQFKQIQKCAKMMEGMMPVTSPYVPIAEGENGKSVNVCE